MVTASLGFLYIDNLALVLEEDAERELGTDVSFGSHTDHSFEGFDNLLADDESKTDTLTVLLLNLLDAAEELEQLDSLRVRDANTSVGDGNDNLVTFLIRDENLLEIVVLVESDLFRSDEALSNTVIISIAVAFEVDEVLGHIPVNLRGSAVLRLSLDVLADDVNLTVVLSELEGIGLKVREDLLKS